MSRAGPVLCGARTSCAQHPVPSLVCVGVGANALGLSQVSVEPSVALRRVAAPPWSVGVQEEQ